VRYIQISRIKIAVRSTTIIISRMKISSPNCPEVPGTTIYCGA
jgi:hypothetical protein